MIISKASISKAVYNLDFLPEQIESTTCLSDTLKKMFSFLTLILNGQQLFSLGKYSQQKIQESYSQ